MTDSTRNLSASADAIWEAFNQEEAGIFVDYGDKLASALRELADQVIPIGQEPEVLFSDAWHKWHATVMKRHIILDIAAELEGWYRLKKA